MQNHVGADPRVCPVEKENSNEYTQNRANTQVRPYENNLPEGWQIMSLEEIAEINPKIDKSKISDNTLVSCVPMQAVGAGDGRIDTSIKKHFADVKKGYTPFQPNDVLFAKITPCMENGKIAVVPALLNILGFGSTEFHVIRPKNGIDPRYIYYYISRVDYRKEAASKMTGAVGQKRVSTDFIKSSTIPLAPLDQQKLIVAEIEKQFSRLDKAVAALKRIQANLKRYKASVLKAAVEGKLTEKWRRKNPDVEPASKLLNRILAERRKKWEEDYVNKYVAAHGHAPKDDSWKKKYKEPTSPDTLNLSELPKGWAWANVMQLCFINSGQTPKGIQLILGNGDIPWFRVGDMNTVGNEKFMHRAEIYLTINDVKKLGLNIQPPGTIIFPKRGGAIATNKKRILSKPSTFDLNTMGLLPIGIHSNFFWIWFLSINLGRLGDGSNVPQINNKDIEPLIIPLPPISEQFKIASEVEQLLSVDREIETVIETNFKRAERLRQSILKKAFSGKLTLKLKI